jgi:polyphenol oxidase
MPFQQAGSLRYYQFDLLRRPGLVQAVFTRQGGVSPAPWDSLNVGGTVGDERERVIANRQRSFSAMQRAPASLYDVWQVHSTEVIQATGPRGEATPRRADAMISDAPAVTLFMRFADCVPVLLFDPRAGAFGIVHAGWLGTVRRVVPAAVRAMGNAFGCRGEDLLAGIGPSIGPDHYPVGDEVVDQVRACFGRQADAHLQVVDGQVRLDLWSANRALLEEEGVTSIEVSGICTACHLEDWYSHRGEHGRTGRFGALIALET